MQLSDMVDFWAELREPDAKGRWIHPTDGASLEATPNTFNFDHPVSPFVGDILNAPVIILGLNAGYDAQMTPREFPDAGTLKEYLSQVADPSRSKWRLISDYYMTSNSWRFLSSRDAAWVNASPYRSPGLSREPQNQRLASQLASTRFHNRWMEQAVLPLAQQGKRLIAVKRKSLWCFLSAAGDQGLSVCKSFVGKHLDARVISDIEEFLQKVRFR